MEMMKMAAQINLKTLYFSKKLEDNLDNIKQFPLTVLEAPSGFGKTTALNYFFGKDEFKGASIQKRTFFSANVSEYWKYFCGILELADPVSAGALKQIKTPDDENMPYIREVMQDLDCAEDTYVILDNLTAPEDEMRLFLTALSCSRAKKLHIVLSVQTTGTTAHPSAAGSAYFMEAADFAFSKEDCRSYYAAAGIVLTESETDRLYEMTGGWAFAVYLQLLFYVKNRRFEGGILDNLIEKAFFAKLNEAEKMFYLSLFPLDCFTVRQAAELGGVNMDFVQSHICGVGFIHYDRKKGAYYFHALLRSYLQRSFDCLHEELRNRIYLKAAQLEETCGEKIAAISLYYKAGAYEKILAMPRTSYDLPDISDADTKKMIFDILDKTPCEVKLQHCTSLIPLAFILFSLGEIEKLFEVIEEIKDLLQKSALSPREKTAALGEIELLISFTAYNDIAEMSRHHRRAYELLRGKANLINIRSTWTFGSPSIMCLYHRTTGELQKELELMDTCMPVYYALTGGHGSGSEFAMRAEAELMRGELDNAEQLAYRAAFEAQSKQQYSVFQSAQFVLANTALLRGDETRLFEALYAMSESASNNEEDMCRYTFDLFTGYLYAFTHRAGKVPGWLADGDISDNRLAPMTIPFAQIVYAKVLLEKEEYIKLIAFCQFAEKMSRCMHTVLPQIYFSVFECCAKIRLGRSGDAETVLSRALALRGGDEIDLPFAQCFSILDIVLRKAAEKDFYEKVKKLGTAFEKSAEFIGTDRTRLTRREAEVAELITQGFTNKQIAARLYISFSTVKLTVSNIFEKTGVRSRTQLADLLKK